MQVPRTRRGKLAAQKGVTAGSDLSGSHLRLRDWLAKLQPSNRSTPVSPRSAGLDDHGQAAQNLRGLPRTVP
jgi:hypothetical protein